MNILLYHAGLVPQEQAMLMTNQPFDNFDGWYLCLLLSFASKCLQLNLNSCSCLGKVNKQPAVPCWSGAARASDVSCREEQLSHIQEGTLDIVQEGCQLQRNI